MDGGLLWAQPDRGSATIEERLVEAAIGDVTKDKEIRSQLENRGLQVQFESTKELERSKSRTSATVTAARAPGSNPLRNAGHPHSIPHFVL